MDSASPIAARTAGKPSDHTGINFTFAMETAEKLAVGGRSRGTASRHRSVHRRPHGEGQPA